jgi:NADPH-dependent 7-cyano-7-deazaguanine reductase QueF-like protein
VCEPVAQFAWNWIWTLYHWETLKLKWLIVTDLTKVCIFCYSNMFVESKVVKTVLPVDTWKYTFAR